MGKRLDVLCASKGGWRGRGLQRKLQGKAMGSIGRWGIWANGARRTRAESFGSVEMHDRRHIVLRG